MTDNYVQEQKQGFDRTKNSKAVTSFVLSVVSIVLCPLLVLQILGFIFGIKGLKSEKKGFAISGIVISCISFILGVIMLISIIAFSMFAGIYENTQIRADETKAIEISNAIVTYINESKDYNLTFGENLEPTVEEILERLEGKFIVGDKTYGGYLTMEIDSDFRPSAKKHTGWEIIVNSREGIVEVTPSTDGDRVLIEKYNDTLDFDTASENVNVKRVGEKNYGFVDIPSDWVKFNDVNVEEEIIQYSDLSSKSIITLNAWKAGDENAKDVASSIWARMEDEGAIGIEGAFVELAEHSSYQVYGLYPEDEIILVAWAFKTDDGYMHYVSIESTMDDVFELVNMIEESFSLEE
ncbi:UNVERIFIED_CONTAM: hypothetical protein Cloal_0327 [Acetivibrio alkalicellulosi]